MMILDKDNLNLVPESAWKGDPTAPPPVKPSKIAASIEPGSRGIKAELIKKQSAARMEKGESNQEESELSEEEMLAMTKKVLRSKTILKSALAANIRAFHHAVIREEETMAKDVTIEEMRVELAEIRKLLLQVFGEQKRDAAAQGGNSHTA